MNILVLNAGSASLKFEVMAMPESPSVSEKQRKLISGIVEGIGEEATFSLLQNKQPTQREKIAAADYGEATRQVLKWLDGNGWQAPSTTHQLDAVGHRIVHGGDRFTESVVIDTELIAVLGVSGRSHDTRELVRLIDTDERAAPGVGDFLLPDPQVYRRISCCPGWRASHHLRRWHRRRYAICACACPGRV